MNWLKHSGLDIHIRLNPFHWQWIPRLYKGSNREWPDCLYQSYHTSWLFLRIHLWIDDGSW